MNVWDSIPEMITSNFKDSFSDAKKKKSLMHISIYLGSYVY